MVFQLCAKHKSWKPSLRLIHLNRSTQDNFHDQWLIISYPDNPWFDPFTRDWGDLMGHFLLVRLLTLKACPTLCYSLLSSTEVHIWSISSHLTSTGTSLPSASCWVLIPLTRWWWRRDCAHSFMSSTMKKGLAPKEVNWHWHLRECSLPRGEEKYI